MQQIKSILSYFLIAVTIASCNNDKTAGADSPTSANEEKPSSGKFDCSTFLWFKEGTVMEYTNTDGKGKVIANTTTMIEKVYQDGAALVADYTVSYKDKKLKSSYKCEGDVLYVNMKSMFEDLFAGLKERAGLEIEVADAYLSFPWKMKEGDELDESAFEIKSKQNGKDFMTMKSQIKNRKVAGTEKITTPAGTWDCVKLLETRVVTMSMMGNQMPAKEMKSTQWFAPGAGLVKSVTYDDKDQPMNTTELVSLK